MSVNKLSSTFRNTIKVVNRNDMKLVVFIKSTVITLECIGSLLNYWAIIFWIIRFNPHNFLIFLTEQVCEFLVCCFITQLSFQLDPGFHRQEYIQSESFKHLSLVDCQFLETLILVVQLFLNYFPFRDKPVKGEAYHVTKEKEKGKIKKRCPNSFGPRVNGWIGPRPNR